ncbi:hypothetical protein SAMN06265218_101354 [Fodinibius sediminis]|uniref:Uncharacterized protein n=2 Tax=Fodinibius sediminis TaxID=1214077 RepID=A0A521ASU3_9BACT|nr:hypothetical protein SAMN06265218_101354 [Fodinibius sediminis]
MEHNIALVFENALNQIKSGNETPVDSFTHFTLPHIQKLKFLPNGRVLLSSIDERLRLQGNTLNNLKFMPKPKRIGDEDS